MSKRPNHAEAVALRKVGNPDGFSIFAWERLGDGSTLIRMKFEVIQANGKQRKWSGDEKTACVTKAEIDAEIVRYEAETGMCAECGGTKQEWAGWSISDGNKYIECRRCGGTGRVPDSGQSVTVEEAGR